MPDGPALICLQEPPGSLAWPDSPSAQRPIATLFSASTGVPMGLQTSTTSWAAA